VIMGSDMSETVAVLHVNSVDTPAVKRYVVYTCLVAKLLHYRLNMP
jgi:hypothetical protein